MNDPYREKNSIAHSSNWLGKFANLRLCLFIDFLINQRTQTQFQTEDVVFKNIFFFLWIIGWTQKSILFVYFGQQMLTDFTKKWFIFKHSIDIFRKY